MAWNPTHRSYNAFADALLRAKLLAVTAANGPLAIRVAAVSRLHVDAAADVRKGRKYVTFDASFTLVWEGYAPSGAVAHVTRGEVAVADLMQDDAAGEFQIRLTTFSSATAFDTTCRDLMAGKGCAAVRAAVRSFAADLTAHDDAREAAARAAAAPHVGAIVVEPAMSPLAAVAAATMVTAVHACSELSGHVDSKPAPQPHANVGGVMGRDVTGGVTRGDDAAAASPQPTHSAVPNQPQRAPGPVNSTAAELVLRGGVDTVAAGKGDTPAHSGALAAGKGESEWNKDAFHWEERPLTAWATERLSALLLGVDIDIPGGCIKVVDVKLRGDASASLRRGKRLVFFEFVVSATWEGTLLDAESGAVTGTGDGALLIPDIDQDSGADYEIRITPAEDGGAKDAQLAGLFAAHGAGFVRRRIAEFVDELKLK